MNSIGNFIILPRYHCPKYIFFVDKLPTTQTDKPNRAKIKEFSNTTIKKIKSIF